MAGIGRRSSRLPTGYLAAALAASAASLFFIFSQSKGEYLAATRSHAANYAKLAAAGSLLVMDAKLTLAANLAVVTGEPRYWREHELIAAELDADIKKLGGDLPEGASVLTVNEANLKIAELERRAMRSARSGKKAEAFSLLAGREYSDLEKTYGRGVARILNELEEAQQSEEETRRKEVLRDVGGAAASLTLALIFWTLFSFSVFRWVRTKGAAEEMVVRKDEEFRHFFNTVQEVFYRADWKGRITDITPSIYRYSGFTREELLGVPVSNLYLNPEDRGKLIKEIVTKGIIEDYEVKLKTKDRGVLDILVNARLLKGFGGLPVGIEGSLRDITVRKAAELKLERMNRLYTILSQVNEAIVRIRERQKLLEEVCRIAVEAGGLKFAWVGVPDQDGKVRPIASYGPGEDYLRGMNVFLAPDSPAGKGPTAVAARENRVVINADTVSNPAVAPWRGAMLAAGFRSSAAFPIAGTGVVNFYAPEAGFFMEDEERLLASLAEDITYAVNSLNIELSKKETESQLEHTREQLRQSQKMEAVGRLAGGIAHDFNNMLTAILSYAGFLKNGLEASDPRRGDVNEIISAAERAATLTKQLLAFSRRQMLLPRIINLNDVVRGTEGMLRRLIGENIDFSLRLAGDIGSVKADPGQLEQVLLNLVVNARDAITGRGRIIVETAAVYLPENAPGRHDIIPPGRYVRLIVSDTGAGMGTDTLSHIFEPFFTTKEQGKGTGLGLSMVYGIVKQSGGYVWVYSEPGRGTSFKLYFPESLENAGGAAPGAEAPHEKAAGGDETLLLAEDDAQVRAAISRVLKEAGYKVLEAADGAELLSLGTDTLKGTALLITDLMMPKMGGIELSASVRALVPGLPVLYISGYSEELVAARENIGAGSFFVQKPVSSGMLLRRVREAINSSAKK